jgi:osmotically-inducible protein OsmY
MSVIVWIGLAMMAVFVASKAKFKHRSRRLVVASVLALASAGSAGAASAANAPDTWIMTKVATMGGDVIQSGTVPTEDARSKVVVEKCLEGNDDLADANIEVDVAAGAVRLSGTVDSQSNRLAALTVARNIEGMRSVSGDLEVRAR